MKKLLVAALLLLHLPCFSRQPAPPKVYLSGWDSLRLDTVQYRLAYSSHPTRTFCLQEYLPAGEALPDFHHLLLAELLLDGPSAAELVQAKKAALERLKKSNPVVQYASYEKRGEYLLDFLLSVTTANDKVALVERNVYRYVPVTIRGGRKGVLLVGASERAYGDDVTAFLADLKDRMTPLLLQIGSLTILPVAVE